MFDAALRYPGPFALPGNTQYNPTNLAKMQPPGPFAYPTWMTAQAPPKRDTPVISTTDFQQRMPMRPSKHAYHSQHDSWQGQVSSGSTRQAFAGSRARDGHFSRGYGYPQCGPQQYAGNKSSGSAWLQTAPPPQPAEYNPLARNWYAPPVQYPVAWNSTWFPPPQHQPLTQNAFPADVAVPPEYYNQQQVPSLNANAPPFAPPIQQGVESVNTSALLKRLGIDKKSRYPKPGSKSTLGQKQPPKRPKRNKKEAKQNALDESQTSVIDHFARAPLPGETTVQPQVQQAKVPEPRFKAQKRLNVMARPTPITAYLQRAFQPAQALEFSRPLLVILDLNGTLLVRLKYGGSNPFIPRPHLHAFLDYLFDNHIVMVWSSSKPINVQRMCSDLFTPEQQSKLAAVWARDKLRLPGNAYNEKVQVYKQLSWVWEDSAIQSSNPVPNSVWSQANTVLIDDSFEKSASEPHNLVELEEFTAAPEQMNTDLLGQVAVYLDNLRSQSDVSAYMRAQPFVFEQGEAAKVERAPDEIDAVIARATGEAL